MPPALARPRAVLDLVEQAYREGDIDTWAERLLPVVRDLLPDTQSAAFYQMKTEDRPDGLEFEIKSPLQWLGPPLFDEAWLQTLTRVPPAQLKAMLPRTFAAMSSSHAISSLAGWNEAWRAPIIDSLGISFRDPVDNAFIFFTGVSTVTRLSPRETTTLTKLAVHLGTARRLAMNASRDRLAAAEAVLSPNGKVLHAAPLAQTRRDALEEGRQRRRQALAPGRAPDVDKALEVWRGLVAGRWSLVDHFDTDGKQFLLAMKNAPRTQTVVDLTPREGRVCALAAMGHRDKEIAYLLGLSMSSVTAALHRARKKLQVTTRVELAQAWKARADGGDTAS